jgi:pyrroloquinoline quinone (PQQ) biosynthesis protein C
VAQERVSTHNNTKLEPIAQFASLMQDHRTGFTRNQRGTMAHEFIRTGDLKSIGSYPVWLQRVVRETSRDKARVVDHELFALMRDARLPLRAMQRFLVGVWPTIEQFPRFMAMNLKKADYGESLGHDMARRYLIHNIRVEQKHADHWAEWAKSADVSLGDLRGGSDIEGLSALAHWCWYVCDKASLPVAMAATNYAVEGATGEWACVVCSLTTYAESLPSDIRVPAMRWLKVHAEYDDTHPWEALDIVATLLGHAPSSQQIAEIQRAIRSSYRYMEMALDHAMLAAIHGTFDETASNASTLEASELQFG